MEYPNNSEMSKQKLEEQKLVKKKFSAPSSTIKDSIVKTSESATKSFFRSLFTEDLDTVWDVILSDVIKPWLMNGLFDVIVNGARTWIFGKGSAQVTANPHTGYIDYSKPSSAQVITSGKSNRQETKTKMMNPSLVPFNNRGAAEVALANMREMIGLYNQVSIGDFCDLCGIDCEFTCYNYGWTNLDTATIQPDRDGYHILFPAAKPISAG